MPLHVFRPIGTATGQRLDVVDDIAPTRPLVRAGRRTRMLLLEFDLGTLAALDAGFCWRDQTQAREARGKNELREPR